MGLGLALQTRLGLARLEEGKKSKEAVSGAAFCKGGSRAATIAVAGEPSPRRWSGFVAIGNLMSALMHHHRLARRSGDIGR